MNKDVEIEQLKSKLLGTQEQLYKARNSAYALSNQIVTILKTQNAKPFFFKRRTSASISALSIAEQSSIHLKNLALVAKSQYETLFEDADSLKY